MGDASAVVDAIWSDLQGRLEGSLRVVTRYDGAEFETRMRADVREQYDRAEDRDIVDDTVVDQLGRHDTEQAFRAGDLNGVVRVFDEALVVSWPDDLPSKSGVIVSVDRGPTGEGGDDLDAVLAYLEDGVPGVAE